MTKICKVCGKSFEPKRSNQVYCSKECYLKHKRWYSRVYHDKRKKALKRICLWCKKEFSPVGKEKYCSEECKRKAQNQRNLEYKKRNKRSGYPCGGYYGYQRIPIKMCLNCKSKRCRYDVLDRERQGT